MRFTELLKMFLTCTTTWVLIISTLMSLSQLLCSSVQQVLFEEEERASRLQERVTELEKKNQKLKDRVGKLKRSLRKERKTSLRYEHELHELQQRMRSNKMSSEHHLNSIAPPHRLSRHRHAHTL